MFELGSLTPMTGIGLLATCGHGGGVGKGGGLRAREQRVNGRAGNTATASERPHLESHCEATRLMYRIPATHALIGAYSTYRSRSVSARHGIQPGDLLAMSFMPRIKHRLDRPRVLAPCDWQTFCMSTIRESIPVLPLHSNRVCSWLVRTLGKITKTCRDGLVA